MMKKLVKIGLAGALCGALGAFVSEIILVMLSSINTNLVGNVGSTVYKVIIGAIIASAGLLVKEYSARSFRQPLAGAVSIMIVTIIWPVGSTIGSWFVMALSMSIFTCAVALAGKMSLRNGIAGLIAGISTGILSSIIIYRVGGVINWALAGLIMWLIIAAADNNKVKLETEDNTEEAVESRERKEQ